MHVSWATVILFPLAGRSFSCGIGRGLVLNCQCFIGTKKTSTFILIILTFPNNILLESFTNKVD